MRRTLQILFFGVLILLMGACSGGDDSSAPPPVASACPGGANVAVQGPEGAVTVSGPPGSRTVNAYGPEGAVSYQGPRPCPSLTPQQISDVQTAYNNAKTICCSVYKPVATAIAASYPNPNPYIPPVNAVTCNDAVVQAVLIGKAVYAPWGGDAYDPYKQYMMSQGKALVNCVGGGITDPVLAGYVALAGIPVLQANATGAAAPYYNLMIPYALQAAQVAQASQAAPPPVVIPAPPTTTSYVGY